MDFRENTVLIKLTYADKGVSSTDGSIELSRYAKIDQLDVGIVSEEHILTLDVTMNDLVGMQVSQTAQYLAANVGDPVLFEKIILGRFDQVRDGAGTAKLHHQP